MVRKIAYYVKAILVLPIYVVISIFPKKRGLILFSAWKGEIYGDNPKYIFEYAVNQSDKEVIPYWVTTNKLIYKNLKKQKIPVLYKPSIKYYLYLIMADALVFTHSVAWEYTSFLVSSYVKKIQVWHGVPIKKIAKDDDRHTVIPIFQSMKQKFFPYMTERIDLALACGEEDAVKYQTAFDLKKEKIKVTGYARNDNLINHADKKNQKIIYMPTFRGDIFEPCSLINDYKLEIEAMDLELGNLDITLDIKLHPVKKLIETEVNLITKCKNIKIYDSQIDFYNKLAEYSLLITDFSGVYIDFLITGKPVIIYAFDYEGYLRNDRSLYYSLSEISVDSPCFTWEDVLRKVKIIQANSWINHNQAKYQQVSNMFHKYKDSKSSERAWNEVKNYIKYY